MQTVSAMMWLPDKKSGDDVPSMCEKSQHVMVYWWTKSDPGLVTRVLAMSSLLCLSTHKKQPAQDYYIGSSHLVLMRCRKSSLEDVRTILVGFIMPSLSIVDGPKFKIKL